MRAESDAPSHSFHLYTIMRSPEARLDSQTGAAQGSFDMVDFMQEDGRRVESFPPRTGAVCACLEGERVLEGPVGERLKVPQALVHLILHAADAVAHGGNPVRIARDQEYVTRQGTQLLSGSRPHLVRLLDLESLPGSIAGSRRCLPLGGLQAYKSQKAGRLKGAFEDSAALNEEIAKYAMAQERR